MTKMRAVDAAVLILEREGATQAFGLPGAAINPFYAALRARGYRVRRLEDGYPEWKAAGLPVESVT